MAFSIDDVDLKHLKKGKFGPLDIYPQEEKQKEVWYIEICKIMTQNKTINTNT